MIDADMNDTISRQTKLRVRVRLGDGVPVGRTRR
jgi:hypothetical protein